jgi:phosphoribosylanthranilate isomerase|tara:strand:- start:1034 stop:1702 length:669 start_codon:yes stop_codon:yes gene_type:complete
LAVSVKICGLKSRSLVDFAVNNGASYIGFVFFPRSPRNISISEYSKLSFDIPKKVKTVAVTVNPTDKFLESLSNAAKPDYIQLHGSETPERAKQVKNITGASIIKAVSVEFNADVDLGISFEGSVDKILFDAKPPKEKKPFLPGGNALQFDWSILARRAKHLEKIDWILSGGLNIANVSDAIKVTGAKVVDVSSGVESSPGNKQASKIKDFINVTNSLRVGN